MRTDMRCSRNIHFILLVPFLLNSSSLSYSYLSFSWKAIILPDIICNKVHFHTWNLPPAHQGTVQGSVHRVDNNSSGYIVYTE